MGINRISWAAIEKPDALVYGGADGVVTGITSVGGRMISILDFEKITFDISPETGIQISDLSGLSANERTSLPILVAEDSALLRRMILDALMKSGYSNVIMTTNGQEAWTFLLGIKAHTELPLFEQVRCVITDIEMPQLDGHRLTKLIKSDSVLNRLPVIIFSSLIDENMMLKGTEVGADAQLSKPEIEGLVTILGEVLANTEM